MLFRFLFTEFSPRLCSLFCLVGAACVHIFSVTILLGPQLLVVSSARIFIYISNGAASLSCFLSVAYDLRVSRIRHPPWWISVYPMYPDIFFLLFLGDIMFCLYHIHIIILVYNVIKYFNSLLADSFL